MDHEGLGLDHATLRWNAVSESTKRSTGTPIGNAASKQKKRTRTPSSSDEASSTIADSSDESGLEEEGGRSFQLRDVSVVFPEGKLTVVTGPTASGKTALLVWCYTSFLLFLFISYKYLAAGGSRGNDSPRWPHCHVKRFLAGR